MIARLPQGFSFPGSLWLPVLFSLLEGEDMTAVSEMLRSARLEKGASLYHVEEATKIRVKYLEALENGDYGAMPARVYALGFLRAYAIFLCLDVQALVSKFNQECPPPEDKNEDTQTHLARLRWPFSRGRRFH